MASENIDEWIKKNKSLVGPRILETGARRYAEHSTLDLRAAFPRAESYVGMDLEDGDGVDVVCDLRWEFPQVLSAVKGASFDTVFCISVLEHVDDVFKAAKNISRLMKPEGLLFLSVPFVFRHHGYPSDYWRFTPEALEFLFSDLDFELHRERGSLTTLEKDDVSRIPPDFERRNRFMHRPKEREAKVERKELKERQRSGEEVDMPAYSLAPTMVNMIARRPPSS